MTKLPFDKADIIRKLVDEGLVDKTTLSRVLFLARNREIDVLQVLVNYSRMDAEQIQQFVSKNFDMPRIDLNDLVLNPAVVKLLPQEVALAHRLIPAFKIVNRTHIAVSNPFDFDGINHAIKVIGDKSDIFLAPEAQVVDTIRNFS